jgi:hypothetical protein
MGYAPTAYFFNMPSGKNPRKNNLKNLIHIACPYNQPIRMGIIIQNK